MTLPPMGYYKDKRGEVYTLKSMRVEYDTETSASGTTFMCFSPLLAPDLDLECEETKFFVLHTQINELEALAWMA